MGAGDTAWEQLGRHLRETNLLGSIQSTLYWDQNTRMPSGGAAWRGEQLALLARQLHARQSAASYADLIAEARQDWRAANAAAGAAADPDLVARGRNLDLLEQICAASRPSIPIW
jgi:Zn-dependent carboxypeptidase